MAPPVGGVGQYPGLAVHGVGHLREASDDDIAERVGNGWDSLPWSGLGFEAGIAVGREGPVSGLFGVPESIVDIVVVDAV